MQPAHQLGLLLFQVPVTTAEEALEALRRGSRARQKARTALNGASSRSHSIFTIAVDARQVSQTSELVLYVSYRSDCDQLGQARDDIGESLSVC
jgi:Kinesin motor domain